jgi:hypothetical protein
VQVFFVPDKANPGWSVVVKKEARGRRLGCSEVEYYLGQEEYRGDRDVFTEMQGERREAGDENCVVETVARTREGIRLRVASPTHTQG